MTKFLEKVKNLQFFKQFVLKNSEIRFQKAETRFQKAETRFQNAKTDLSRIFFARIGMDSAQKKPACSNSILLFFVKNPSFQWGKENMFRGKSERILLNGWKAKSWILSDSERI